MNDAVALWFPAVTGAVGYSSVASVPMLIVSECVATGVSRSGVGGLSVSASGSGVHHVSVGQAYVSHTLSLR